MEFSRICAFAAICCLMVLLLSKREKELSAVISSFIYIAVVAFAVSRLSEIFSAFKETVALQGKIQYADFIFKAAGISVIATVAASVCEDSGQKGTANAVEIFAVLEIVCIGLPVLKELFALVTKIFGA